MRDLEFGGPVASAGVIPNPLSNDTLAPNWPSQELNRYEARLLRQVFAMFPTGVAVIAACVDGRPSGMAVNSFTSVSLNPPLVSVCMAVESRTWPTLRRARSLGVSILAQHHEQVSRQMSAREGDRFGRLPWRVSRDGAMFLNGSAAWFECSLYREVEAGDHWIVLLCIRDLASDPGVLPLVFHGSRYRFLAV